MWTLRTAALAAENENDLYAWDWLIRTGHVWRLPRWFGLMASSLIASGQLTGA